MSGLGCTVTPLVSFDGVTKRFGATLALDEVSLELVAGEVHVIAGQNGAGKSTLIKILSGVHAPDAGTLRVEGQPVALFDPAAAKRAGVATIHQELSLVGPMTVGDNLLLGERGSAWSWLRRRQRREQARKMLAALELDIDPDRPLETLSLATRQLVEIARALGSGARVLVMDEPTSALPEEDAERLFEHVQALKERGSAIVYISHRMEELARLADRITVLRDGRVVASEAAEAMSPGALVRHMVGGEVAALEASSQASDAEPILAVEGLSATSHGARLDEVELSLRPGEIVGVAGLQGSGASLLPRAIFGAIPVQGRIALGGQPIAPVTPRRSLSHGMVLLSGDRADALVASLSLVDNATLSSLDRYTVGPWLKQRPRLANADRVLSQLKVVHPGLDAPVASLSGGNQQKVALARAVLARPKVLLLDEPTRGIDVAAKRDVHATLQRLAAEGLAILIVSTDLDELVALSHRALVLVDGRIRATLFGDELTRAALLAAAMGHEVA